MRDGETHRLEEESPMKIKDRPEYKSKSQPLTCTDTTSILEAAQMMAEKSFGSIIVTDAQNKVLGVVTERDLMVEVVAEGLDPKTSPVSAIMSRDVKVARPDDEVRDWLRIMSNERFRRLPIVDETGSLVSVMTQGDLVSYTWPSLFGQMGEVLGQSRETAKRTLTSNTQLTVLVVGFTVYALASLVILFLAVT